jgi:O-antigen biosynthesis protein
MNADVTPVVPMWAGIDTEWYLRQYSQDLTEVEHTSAALVAFYHTEGVKRRHSPNPYFDERWYLAHNADVAGAVAEGSFASGFEHYGLTGHKQRSPHWLFSESFYFSEHNDLTADMLRNGRFVNGYDHYLRTGDREFRSGHWMFDPGMHRSATLGAEQAPVNGGEYSRFVSGDRRVASTARISWYFDPDWYLTTYPAVREEIQAGQWSCALEHYLCNAAPASFNPNAHFDEDYYRNLYPEIHPLLESGRIRNSFEHFLRYGATERRSPNAQIDLQDYFKSVQVQTDLEQRHFRDVFAHYESTGGKAPQPPGTLTIDEEDGRKLFRMTCNNLLPGLVRHPMDFQFSEPKLTVILVAANHFAFTMATLASLRSNFQREMQVILVDNGSKDEVSKIELYVKGLEVVRFRYNTGFVDACNAALKLAKADTTLYLNNDVQLNPGAVQNALVRLWSEHDIGAVGGKIIRSHGKLQEAGSIIWRDGLTVGYLRDMDPNVPEANFVRPVDFCSAAFLLCKTALLRSLDGFDTDYRPAYFEEADLCIRMRKLGYKIMYDPAVSLIHYEYASSNSDMAMRLIGRNHPIFRRKNAEFLRRQSFRQASFVTTARSAASGQRRILFIEDRLPFRHLGSGFTRSNDIVHLMAEFGHHVTIYPIYKATETLSAIYKAFPDTVEVIYDRELPDLETFLTERSGYYDAIWIARTHNADRLASILERCAPHIPTPRIILDTEAIASARLAEREKVVGTAEQATTQDLGTMVRRELGSAFLCQRIVAVNELDAKLVRDTGFADVEVLGHVQTPEPAPRGWKERSGLLFLASIPDAGSPNLDALSWFSSSVLPLLETMLPSEVEFIVAGNIARRIDLSLLRQNRRVKIYGPVADLKSVYDTSRVFVAPTRFAGGIPYKIHEAAAYGLPIVASPLLCRQVGWTAGEDIACGSIEDPGQFAEAIVRLYDDEEAWSAMQQNALRRIREENSPKHYRERLSGILSRLFA